MTVPRPIPRDSTDTPSATAPRLSVVIVNYNTWPDTAALTRQLLAERRAVEVVVVDNHSRPHRLLKRLRRRRGVSLRRWGRNRGFGRAVNEGVRLSRGDWLLFLNPDTSLAPGFLDDAINVADRAAERVGIVGFRIHHTDGSVQASVGHYPTLVSTVWGLRRPRSERKFLKPQPDLPCEADWLSGCCLLVRRECFQQLDGFDADFFLYYEDVDLCRRAMRLGWSIRFDPSLSVVHHRPLHVRPVPPHIRLFTRHSLLTYAVKHWPRWQTVGLALVVAIEALLRRWKAWRRGERRTGRIFAQMFGLAVDFIRGRFPQARARVARIARQEELCRVVGRHSEPQSSRSAASVPEQCHQVRAAGDRDPRD